MDKTPQNFELKIDELVLTLPLERGENVNLYALKLMGQARLNRLLAQKLAGSIRRGDCEAIVAVEAKSIALVQELSNLLDMEKYVVLRKTRKVYMKDPLSVSVNSISTETRQQLYLDYDDAEYLSGKRITFVDDVISTGATLNAVKKLMELAPGCHIAQIACIATEGEYLKSNPLGYVRLGHIPLYSKSGESI